jgi:hypothetical protein
MYWVEIHSSVLDYLRGRLSAADHDRVIEVFTLLLAQGGDLYRFELHRRVAAEAHAFEVDFLFEDSAGAMRLFRFVVDDEYAEAGVLRVLYVDER